MRLAERIGQAMCRLGRHDYLVDIYRGRVSECVRQECPRRGPVEPMEDISDFSDEYVAGYLAGQEASRVLGERDA